MSLKLNSSGGGSVTLNEPVTASNRNLSLPDADGTLINADGSGNVGIGTSSPQERLHLQSTGDIKLRIQTTDTSTSTGNAGLFLLTGSYGYFLQNLTTSAGSQGVLRLYDTTAGAERFRVDNNGVAMFGTTSTTPGSSSDTKGISLWTNGSSSQIFSTSSNDTAAVFNRAGSDGALIRTRRQGSDVGSISVTGSATAYNTSSDYRLKNITGPLTGSGEFIDALKPKVGTWKVDGSRFVGFLAHEVQEVSPATVVGEKDAVDENGNPIMQAMEYGSAEFIANIVAELQSLRKRVAALEAK